MDTLKILSSLIKTNHQIDTINASLPLAVMTSVCVTVTFRFIYNYNAVKHDDNLKYKFLNLSIFIVLFDCALTFMRLSASVSALQTFHLKPRLITFIIIGIIIELIGNFILSLVDPASDIDTMRPLSLTGFVIQFCSLYVISLFPVAVQTFILSTTIASLCSFRFTMT